MTPLRRFAALAVALVAAAGCGKTDDPGKKADAGAAATASGSAPEVEAFWVAWRSAVAGGNGKALWDMTCAENRRSIIERTRAAMGAMPDKEWTRIAASTRLPESEVRGMSAEALAEVTTIAMLERMQGDELAKVEKAELRGIDVEGDRATIRFRTAEGKDLSMVVVREDGGWKADLAKSAPKR